MFLVFCLLQKLSSTHLTLHPLDLKTTLPHPSSILQLNKYLTQTNVSSPGISFDTIKHSNHIDDNVFVIQFLIWGQQKTGFPHPFMHAWRVTHHGLYTDKYIWYMSSTCSHTSYGMLADELIGFYGPEIIKRSWGHPSAWMRSVQCTQHCFLKTTNIDKELNLSLRL